MGEVINQKIKNFSKTSDVLQTIIIFFAALLTPLFLGNVIEVMFGAESTITENSQLIVGSIINACLILASFNFDGYTKTFGIITMPSIATILSGYLFGTASTVYLIFMIPAIWLGNFALVYAFKYFVLKENKNYFLASVIGIASKVAIIFLGFLMMSKVFTIPEKIYGILLTAMSGIQAITATIGASMVYIIYKIEK